MEYFIDCEFLEGKQDKTIFGLKYGETKPTADLISIGICSGDGREYYAISKDFNLKEAWNRHDLKLPENMGDEPIKEYWIKENVLKPIWRYFLVPENDKEGKKGIVIDTRENKDFTYSNFKYLINKYGKRNEQIAEEIRQFCLPSYGFSRDWFEEIHGKQNQKSHFETIIEYEKSFEAYYENFQNPKFYGYYSAYDHVALCWLFGKMINLPYRFPRYIIDLKQELDKIGNPNINHLKNKKQNHNALADARFNKKLYDFLKSL